ncbi:hypothetical protein V8G54_007306 [Vigna mungo]|uniref:Uncharacterized protein n=1 Tax=Vigna mungo TaxID=3915 RepID=A0AAQ3S8Y5_VIGMU
MEEVVEIKVSISTPAVEVSKTPKSPFASRFMSTPLASPMKKAIENMQGYFGEVGRFTKLDPQDDWLPITQSRNGNAYYAAFHVLSSGIGFQALLLPFAFTTLGWYIYHFLSHSSSKRQPRTNTLVSNRCKN